MEEWQSRILCNPQLRPVTLPYFWDGVLCSREREGAYLAVEEHEKKKESPRLGKIHSRQRNTELSLKTNGPGLVDKSISEQTVRLIEEKERAAPPHRRENGREMRKRSGRSTESCRRIAKGSCIPVLARNGAKSSGTGGEATVSHSSCLCFRFTRVHFPPPSIAILPCATAAAGACLLRVSACVSPRYRCEH